MSIITKTAILSVGITMISFDRKYPYIYIKNFSNKDIYASEKSNFQADDDNVTRIPAGTIGLIYRNSEIKDIYILAIEIGKAEVIGAYDANLSFSYKNSLEGGDSGGSSYDDTEIKNEIADLQNSKVDKVSGKSLSTNDYTTEEKEKLATLENYDDTMIKSDIANKVDNDIFVAENLITFPYASEQNKVGRGVTFSYDDNELIHLVGTGTSTGDAFALASELTLDFGTYTISLNNNNTDVYIRVLGIDESGGTHLIGSVINGEPTTFTIGSENENIYPSYKVVVRVVLDKIYDSYFKPMLEIGSVAHAYQPYKLSRKAVRDDIDAILALSLEV